MIFVDTSVVIAILTGEPDAKLFVADLARARHRLTTVTVRLETCMVLSRLQDISPETAQGYFSDFLTEADIEERTIPVFAGPFAVQAFEQFGKGRHPARLNFGDCLSYACARAFGARLLYKGDDFALTDIGDFAPR